MFVCCSAYFAEKFDFEDISKFRSKVVAITGEYEISLPKCVHQQFKSRKNIDIFDKFGQYIITKVKDAAWGNLVDVKIIISEVAVTKYSVRGITHASQNGTEDEIYGSH